MSLLDSPRRGRPKKDETMNSLALRLPDSMAKEIDEYARRLSEQLPGLNISRADAIRQLLAVGLRSENDRLTK